MSLDRNPRNLARIRRNAQRMKGAGTGSAAATATVIVAVPLENTGEQIQLNLLTAGGLSLNSGQLTISLQTNSGLALDNTGIKVLLNGSSLTLDASGLSVSDGGVGLAKLGALTTKGDLLGYGTAHARLAVGTDGQVLTADSSAATGLAWKTPDKFVWKGEWVAFTSYVPGDVIQYEGSAYINIQAVDDDSVPDALPDYWELLAEKGADGFNFRGEWSSAATYNEDDVAQYEGSAYVALATNTNDQPDTSLLNWDLLVSKGTDGTDGTDGTAPLTTKGDLLGYSTEVVRLAVGTDDQVLTADSSADEGVAWKSLPTATSGEAALTSSFILTSADTVWTDVGLSVDLPSAGTYLLTGYAFGFLSGTGNAFMAARFYNSTAGSVVTNSEVFVVWNDSRQANSPLMAVVTVAAASTIKLQAMRNTNGGTITTTFLGGTTNGRTKMAYVKLA